MEIPETRYARSGDVSIAYQAFGEGPVDLIWVSGIISNIEYQWAEPRFAGYLQRLASFTRVIRFDKRGTGLSDRVGGVPTLEQRMDDVRAVLDDAGSERAVVLGAVEGGPIAILFAATYPERTLALVLYGSYVKTVWSADFPWAPRFEDCLKRSTTPLTDGEHAPIARRRWRGSPPTPTRASGAFGAHICASARARQRPLRSCA